MKEINRLRLKFIFYNMVIVTAVISLTFWVVSIEVRGGVSMRGILACLIIWLGFFVLSYGFSRWAVKPVEDTIRMQKQFVADASHELKTPLTVITANAELLQERYAGQSPETDKWLEHVNGECREMRSLVERLLTLARSDVWADRKKSFCLFSFSELVTEKLLILEPVFYQEHKRLDYQVEEDVLMLGDPSLMARLVEELLDNAVKYSTPKGSARVMLERVGRNKARLWVNSQGEPIPEDKKTLIFRRFYRDDSARASKSGYGLGLAIAAETARSHRARIGVEYRDGWNCFFVTISRVYSTRIKKARR